MQKYYLFEMSVEPKVTRVRGLFVGVSVGMDCDTLALSHFARIAHASLVASFPSSLALPLSCFLKKKENL